MKCPKCKKEMEEYAKGFDIFKKNPPTSSYKCENEKCEYFGIFRQVR